MKPPGPPQVLFGTLPSIISMKFDAKMERQREVENEHLLEKVTRVVAGSLGLGLLPNFEVRSARTLV